MNNSPVTGAITQTVNAVAGPSSLSLTDSSSGRSELGQSVVFTATVVGNSPTGTLACADGSTPFAQNVPLVNGGASCATNSLALGTHTIQASYSGDANNAPASGTLMHTVNPASSSTAGNGSAGGGGGGCTVNATGTPDWGLLLMVMGALLHRRRSRRLLAV